MDSGLKAGREYRCSLPPEDQRELEGGFSENILFAAQALTRGFRIRGIEGFTAELVAPARQLCASMDALRLAFKRRAVLPPMSIAASTSREENNTIRLTTTPSSNTAAAGTAANDNISDSATASTTATTSTATNNYNTPLFVGNCLPEHGDLFPVLAEFDVAWTRFEQKICFCYFSVTYSGRPGRQDETDMFQVSRKI